MTTLVLDHRQLQLDYAHDCLLLRLPDGLQDFSLPLQEHRAHPLPEAFF